MKISETQQLVQEQVQVQEGFVLEPELELIFFDLILVKNYNKFL